MATVPYFLSYPDPNTTPFRSMLNSVSAMAINAETEADARAFAKAQSSIDCNAMWDLATAAVIAPDSNMSGWFFRLRIVNPSDAISNPSAVVFDHTVVADGSLETEVAAIAASKALVSSADYGDTETVTIDGKVYTFRTTIGVLEGSVLRGGGEVATMANLVSAMTHVGGVAGVNYVTAAVHPTVTSASDGVHTVTMTAKVAGAAGNAIAVSETCATAAFAGGATALSGGADAVTSTDKVSSLAEMMVAALNADDLIAGAAFNNSTHVLTVAQTTDALGDHRVFGYFIPPNADTSKIVGVPGFIASQVDGGSSGDALTMTLVADSYTVPTLIGLTGPAVV